MTKAEIVEDISSRTGLTKKEVAEAVDCFLSCISKGLVEGKHYEIRGFGTFKVNKRKARKGINPQTGEKIKIKASRVVKFVPGKALKEKVK